MAPPAPPTPPSGPQLHQRTRALIDAALPHWWQHDALTSVLFHVLSFFAEEMDKLAEAAEGIFADQALKTARFAPAKGNTALRDEWALLFGAEQEELPLTTGDQPLRADDLRSYLQKRARENGTVRSLEDALYAFVPTLARVPSVTFPPSGAGIQFVNGAIAFPEPPILVTDNVPDRQIEVEVTTAVATEVDKPAFERAVQRHQPAHYRPSQITYPEP